MTKYIIDAYAWIEYFEGSNQGKILHKILTPENEILTHAVTVSEVVSRIERKGFAGESAFNAILGLSKIIPLDIASCKEIGFLHASQRKKIPGFGLADTFVLYLSRTTGGKIVTGDPHFQNEKNVLFLAKSNVINPRE